MRRLEEAVREGESCVLLCVLITNEVGSLVSVVGKGVEMGLLEEAGGGASVFMLNLASANMIGLILSTCTSHCMTEEKQIMWLGIVICVAQTSINSKEWKQTNYVGGCRSSS